MADETATVLGALIAERGWDFAKFNAAFRAQAALLADETRTPDTAHATVSDRSYRRWRTYNPKPGRGPQEVHAAILERMFDRPIANLLSQHHVAPMQRVSGAQGGLDWSESSALHEQLEAAARESTERAALNASISLEPLTLDQLHDDIGALARAYPQRAPHTVHSEALRVRDVAALLLERTRRPAQIADLYVISGKAASLLAASAFDLGATRAALAQSRAAWLYGHQADHNGLCAWARGMEALIAYWSGRPDDARRIAQQAQREHASSGTALVRLLAIEARAWAHAGDRENATRAIAAARRESERSAPLEDLHDHTGGEFAFGTARQERSHGTAYLALGEPDLAREHTLAALAQSASGPDGAVSTKVTAQARVDLAAAAAASGDLQDARDHLDNVLCLPEAQRVHGITRRLDTVHRTLAHPRYHNTKTAQDLQHDIVEFARTPTQSRPRPMTP